MVAVATDFRPRTHHGVRSLAEVEEVAAAFGSVSRGGPSSEHGAGGSAWWLTVTPGMVKLGTRKVDTCSPLFGMSRSEWMSENGSMSDEDGPKRGDITGLSQKSRNRMMQKVTSLDYSPLFRPGRLLPKMVTLTVPHRWEQIAPDPVTFKRKLMDKALKQKFRRHWGYDIQAVWKLEFQDRKECRRLGCHDPKAPHLHILMAPPSGLCPQTGETFEEWLRSVWSKACADADSTEQEVRNHRAKGVHIADTFGLTGTDSKRIGDYFAKHGLFSDKEYQNTPPALWQGKAGRFWGVWGLQVAQGEALLGMETPAASGPRWGTGARARPGRAVFGVGEDGPVMYRHAQPGAAELSGLVDPLQTHYVNTKSHYRFAKSAIASPARKRITLKLVRSERRRNGAGGRLGTGPVNSGRASKRRATR